MSDRFALYIAYDEHRCIQTLEESHSIVLMRETMVQFTFEHGSITGIYSDEIGKNTIGRGCTERLNLPLFLYDQTNRYGLYATGRKTGSYFLPKDGRQLKSYDTIEHTARLLGVHQIIVDIARMEDGLLNSRFGDLMKNDTSGVFLVQLQHLFQMPCDCFSLAVLIGSQPYRVRFLGFTAQLIDELGLMRVDDIIRLVSVFKINTHRVLSHRFDIAYMALTAEHMKIRTQKLLNRLGFRRRLHYD